MTAVGIPLRAAARQHVTVLIALGCLVGSAVMMAAFRTDLTRHNTWADQASYLSAALSLAHDHDLRWEAKDLHRFADQGFPGGPRGIILVPSGKTGHWYHSIAWTYPLAASPLVWLMGYRGMLVFNAVLFTILWIMVLDVLRRRLGLLWGGMLAVMCTVFSLPFMYVFVMMAELWNATLLVGCFYLLDLQDARSAGDPHHRLARPSPGYGYPLFIGAAAAIPAIDKPPYGVLVLFLFFLMALRWQHRAVFVGIGAFLAVACAYGLINYRMAGELTIRSDARCCFVSDYPLTPGAGRAIRPGETVEGGLAASPRRERSSRGYSVSGEGGLLGGYRRVKGILRIPDHRLLSENFRFFLVGKYTGILWHQAGLVACFLLLAARRPTVFRVALAGALVITAYAWITLLHHYWSGAHAFGNRYFMPALCTAVFIVPRRPRPAIAYPAIIAASCLTILGYGPVVRAPVENNLYTELHVLRPPFRWGPLEETLIRQVVRISLGNRVTVQGGSAFVFDSEPYTASDRDVIFVNSGHATDILFVRDGVSDTLALCIQAQTPIDYSIRLREYSQHGHLEAGGVEDVAFSPPRPPYPGPLTDVRNLILKVRLRSVEGASGVSREPSYLWIGQRCEDCFPSFRERRFEMEDADPAGFYVHGWGREEQWGERTVRWALGNETTACFRLGEPVSDVVIRAMARTLWQGQHVGIRLNGKAIDQWGPVATGPFALYSTTIPRERLLAPPAVNTVTFRFSVAGRAVGDGTETGDTRQLAVVFDWLELQSME